MLRIVVCLINNLPIVQISYFTLSKGAMSICKLLLAQTLFQLSFIFSSWYVLVEISINDTVVIPESQGRS